MISTGVPLLPTRNTATQAAADAGGELSQPVWEQHLLAPTSAYKNSEGHCRIKMPAGNMPAGVRP